MKRTDYIDKMVFTSSQSLDAEEYWINKLSGELVKTSFPYDYDNDNDNERPTSNECVVKTLKFSLSDEVFSKSMKLSKNSLPKLHMILTAGLILLLFKYTGNDDILVGTSIFKQEIEAEFINSVLVLRNRLKDNMTFKELLLQVRETIIEADKYQNYPIDLLLQRFRIPFSKDDDFPLFDVVILLENIQERRYIEHIKPCVLLSFLHTGECIKGVVEYNSSRYKKEKIERISIHFGNLLQEALFNLDSSVGCIDILSGDEKRRLLFEVNNTGAEYPGNTTVHRLFQHQVEKTPDYIAAACLESGIQIAYRELNQESDQLAYLLRTKGVQANTIVGIMMERSIEMIIGILGILKAGGAYLPIELDSPGERIKFVLADSKTRILLTRGYLIPGNEVILRSCFPGNIVPVEDRMIYAGNTANPGFVGKPGDLAYVLYTSGTTGRPKGVMIEHQGVVNYIWWAAGQYVKGEKINFSLYTSISFDLTVTSIFTPLITGNAIVIYDEDENKEILIEKIIDDNRVGVIKVTPSHLKLVRDKKIEHVCSIKRFIVGGEELQTQLAREIIANFGNRLEIYNEYGPTEAVVGCMIYKFDREKDTGKSVPIGLPIDNTRIYILAGNLDPVPVGVAGEICISGVGTARGYLNQPELTEEKFIDVKRKAPWDSRRSGVRLYRTGDLGWWLPDGGVEFLGRVDHQVKIRGFRVEPGEIENRLLDHPDITGSVVVARTGENGTKYICAYIVSRRELAVSRLREYLGGALPDYMIPSYFVLLDKIPLTPNGKIDRNALPEPELKAGEEYEAPGDQLEEKLVELWADVLGIGKEVIGIDNNFLELGGHSLKAINLITRIDTELGINVPLVEILKNQTIRKLSGYIKRTAGDISIGIKAVEKREYYDLSYAQKSLWSIDKIGKYRVAYNMSAAYIFEGELRREVLARTFETIVKRHESLRTIFVMIGNEPGQKILDVEQMDFNVDHIDLRHLPDPEIRARETADRDGAIAFKLEKGPLLRVKLLQTGDYRHILLFTLHHIISDGWSQEVLIHEALTLYKTYSNGKESPLSPLKIQYRDYAAWHNQLLKSGRLKEHRDYWWSQFMGEIPVLDLSTDFKRSPVRTLQGNYVGFELDEGICKGLLSLGRQNGATLFMTLLASVNLLLYCYSGQDDIILGTVISGRDNKDLTGQMGYFLNTLALRTRFSGSGGFAALLRQVKETLLGAMKHQLYPFDLLVEDLNLKQDMSRSPLFDVMVHLQDMESAIEMEGMSVKSYEFGARNSKFDLMFNFYQKKNSISAVLKYKTDLFRYDTIARMANRFKRLVNNVLENPGKQAADLTFENEREFKIPGISPFPGEDYPLKSRR